METAYTETLKTSKGPEKRTNFGKAVQVIINIYDYLL